MAPITYRELVHSILASIAKAGQESVEYAVIVNRVVAEKHTKGQPLATNHQYFIRRSLNNEAQAGWLTFTGDTLIAFTAAGTIHYVSVDGRSQIDARSEYLRLACIVQEALQGSEPTGHVSDIRNLPNIVRNNLDALAALEESIEDLLEKNHHVTMRLEGF
ncbi:uncharacterized protein TRAVEDRAFT_22749 [Trametes versicolor FP-101664 SS1]|uniref:uncharacterized protein n=1 Tax=Trametes versicolor (strain FP-101664) TaxID=717944 RepID=UPI00046231D9|nr:uncharacterized protein TRAVEDRAFT_22749 [Trametes versicolor FP-101664 SS1]EIW54904.1 hypothetical protein TRAVEDRAFT_22749 [Trametes versicolor FP-101664 SS1]